MTCRVDVRAHTRRCPPKQKELPLKKRRKPYRKPSAKACDIEKVNAKAKQFCARAGESSKLGQKRCLKRAVANMLTVVPGCKGRR